MKYSKLLGPLFAVSLLGGCTAAETMINHSELDVKTHMSESIFLDPVPPDAKTVFVTARNTSDHPELDLRASLRQAIEARGYRVVEDPKQAHYMLRVNVLQAGQIETKDTSAMLMSKYGEPLLAGAGSALVANQFGAGGGATTGIGLGVAAGTFLANQLVKDVTYSVVVDIQLSERPLSGVKVKQSTVTAATGGNGTASRGKTADMPGGAARATAGTVNARAKVQSVDEESDFKQYEIRNVAYANKMNLKFEEAAPLLIARLSSSLSNLFE